MAITISLGFGEDGKPLFSMGNSTKITLKEIFKCIKVSEGFYLVSQQICIKYLFFGIILLINV